MTTATAFERILDTLSQVTGQQPRGGGRQYSARCPAHDDTHASLSVTAGTDRVLLKCHAGCDIDTVLDALKLARTDLFNEPRQPASSTALNGTWTPCGHGTVATYEYVDETGRLLYTVVRCPQKDFAQWRPDPTAKGGRRWNLRNTRRVLYHLPAVLEAVRDKQPVWIAEGEKDADRLTAAGVTATCNPHGAGKWRDEYARSLIGANVTIVADRDDPGRAHAAGVAASLRSVGCRVRIVEAAAGKDASDHLDTGLGLDDFTDIDVPEPTLLDKLRAQLLDTDGLDKISDPEPLVDGVLYLDSLAWLIGPPGEGKSLVALDIAGCVSTGEQWQGFETHIGPSLYLVAEGAKGIRKRVRAWEKAMGHKMADVQFLPVAVQTAIHEEWQAFIDLACEIQPFLIVVDTQARVTVGQEENSAKDMGVLVQRVEQLRQATGACVLLVHHQGRSGEHMRGSTALEGAATTIIRVSKDEDTLAITNPKQKDAAEFEELWLRVVTSGSSVIVTPTDRPQGTDVDGPKVRAMLSQWWAVHESNPVSVSVIIKSGIVSESTFHRAKKDLVKRGLLIVEGKGPSVRYKMTNAPTE